MRCENCGETAIDKVTFDDNHTVYGRWLCNDCQRLVLTIFGVSRKEDNKK